MDTIINFSILNEIVSCLNQGNIEPLKKMGLSVINIRRLSDLNIAALETVASKEGLIDVKINNDLFDLILTTLEENGKDNELIRTLIQADASHKYLFSNFALKREVYIMIRSLLNMPKNVQGIPRNPNKDETRLIFNSWKKHGSKKVSNVNSVLGICKDTKISARVIVREIEKNLVAS